MRVQHTHRFFAIATLATMVLIAGVAIAAVEATRARNIGNQGKGKEVNLGLYWDNTCTNTTIAVDWGMLSPGAASSVTLYVRNEGSSPAKLGLRTQNWNPTNTSDYVILTWNREGQVIRPLTVVTATLTLEVSANASGTMNFSFDTSVIGTKQ